MAVESSTHQRASWAVPRAVLWGALAVGVLDITDAKLYYGVSLMRCFRGVAAGLLGRSARTGGVPATLLGALLHFFIAFVIVYTYYQASRKTPALARQALLWGPLYGIGVFFFMNYFVVPVSAAGSFDRLPWSLPFLLNGVVGQAFLVGLPSALSARVAVAVSAGRASTSLSLA